MRNFLAIALFVFVAGCQTQQAVQTPPKPTITVEKPTGLGAVSAYQPNGREEFVFAEKPELMQQFGYAGFCADKEPCDTRLPYGLYVGKRGYFEETVQTDQQSDWDIYSVVLETGERFYYFASRALGGRYTPVSPIVPVERVQEALKLRYQPLVECSLVYAVASDVQFGNTLVKLSNGRKVPGDKLALIREYAQQFGPRADAVAQYLLDFKIQQDTQGTRWIVTPQSDLKANDIRLYLVSTPERHSLRFNVKYFGGQWLYLRALEFTGDKRSWIADRIQVQRTDKDGQIEEWVDVEASVKDIELMRHLATSDKAVVRLEGARYYDELVLSPFQKEDLLKMLELYDLVRDAPRTAATNPDC